MKITVYPSLDDLPGPCLQMMAEAGRSCFFSGPDWFATLESYGLPPGHYLRYYVASDDETGKPLCILPMMLEKKKGLSSPRRLQSFTSFYSMDFGPIGDITSATGQAALEFLAQAILAEKPAIDIIDIRMLTEGDALAEASLAAFRKAGALTGHYFQFDNWVHQMRGQSAEAYYAERPSRLKNTIKRKRKKFEEAHRLSFLLVRGEENLAKGIADYQAIYAKSWKDSEGFPNFIPELMKCCAQQGILRLGVIYADDKPVAAQFWMIYGGAGRAKTAMIYKLAYDEDYAALSAGSILSKYMMDHAIDADRVEMLDYGVGNDNYKRDWMTVKRRKIGLLAYNRTGLGLMAGAWHFAKSGIRRLLKPEKPETAASQTAANSE